MDSIKLSILIPSLESRANYLDSLLINLRRQIFELNLQNEIEVLSLIDEREKTTGQKRNELIEMSKGDYICFIDDDDIPQPNYISEIIEATKESPDVIPINGWITTNGLNPIYWEMGLNLPYDKSYRENGTPFYSRYPNHISVMKRDLILNYKFQNITIGEDYEWATRLHNDKVFKTEKRIIKPIYHYNYRE